ncbi:MAG: pantetheine-phosphate adenylyltransferase [Lachnospiraceae bacterium]
MIRAIYPGSFDPVTLGHMDIITRSAQKVDELIIGVLNNNKKTPMFTVEERVQMLEELTKDYPNVKVEAFTGLSADFVKKKNANVIIRGLRAITDFDYELQMAQTNRVIYPGADTMFLTTSLEYAYLSSTTVKEVAYFEGDISRFVPETIIERVYQRVGENKNK